MNVTSVWVLTAATVLVIEAENGCLKFAAENEGEGRIWWCTNGAGTKLVRV